jgi:hypothetical protein
MAPGGTEEGGGGLLPARGAGGPTVFGLGSLSGAPKCVKREPSLPGLTNLNRSAEGQLTCQFFSTQSPPSRMRF